MAHGQEVQTLTYFQIEGTDLVFATKGEALAYEQKQNTDSNLVDLNSKIKDDIEKRESRTKDLQKQLEGLRKDLADAKSEKEKEDIELSIEKTLNELEQYEIYDIERAVYLGEKIKDSSLNAYENFKSFVLGQPELFLQIISEYANAYNFEPVEYDGRQLWFGEDFRGLPAKSAVQKDSQLQFEVVQKEG